jgi:WD40 repeat protein
MTAIYLALTLTSGQPPLTALAVAPDDKTLLVGSQAGVLVRGPNDKAGRKLAVKLDHVLCLKFSPDGKTLAIGGGSPAEAGGVELWAWPDEKLLGKLEGHTDLVHDIAWFPDGKTLATASADRTVKLWSVAACKCDATLTGHSGAVLCLAAFADGKTLCSGSTDQTIRVWNVADGKLLRSLDNHLGAVHALALRPGGKADAPVTLASAGADATVRVWQPAVGRLVRIVRLPAPVYCVTWSGDGALLGAAGKDGIFRTIDGDSDQVLAEQTLSKGWIISLARRKNDEIVTGTSQGELVAVPFGLPRDKK